MNDLYIKAYRDIVVVPKAILETAAWFRTDAKARLGQRTPGHVFLICSRVLRYIVGGFNYSSILHFLLYPYSRVIYSIIIKAYRPPAS